MAEPDLRAARFFRDLLDRLPAGAYACDAAGLITWFNAAAAEVWGREPRLDDPVDRFCGSFKLFTPDGIPIAHADCWMALALRERRPFEGRQIVIERPDGERRHALAYASPIFGDDGDLLGAVNVLIDVTEQQRAERELRRAEAALREADQRKNEFLAMLGHELRSPLAPIGNAVEYLRLMGPADPGLEKARDVIDRQLSHLSRLVDDLLEIGRISIGKLELQRARVTLAEVVQSAVETAQPLIDAHGHALALRLPDEPVPLDADPVRLSQVFLNLLANAARYTDPGGHIELRAELEDDAVVVRVRDDGHGIPADQLPLIFEMFVQGDGAAQQGLGIGLALVRSLVEMHGGSVTAASEGRGKGSEFCVRLPRATAAAPEASAPTPARPAGALRRRVLIVDDNRDLALSLEMLLARGGCEVRTAFDGQGALEVAAELRPEVVLLDIGLPDLDGYETCRRLREMPWGRDALLIAVTGWGLEEDKRRALAAGFDHHLTKPVDPAVVRELLAAAPWPSRVTPRP